MSMWNRRKDEEQPVSKPVSAPPRTTEPAKEGIPMSTMSNRPYGQDTPMEPARSNGTAKRIEQRIDVVQRQHTKHAFIRLQMRALEVNLACQQEIALAVHHALRETRGAG